MRKIIYVYIFLCGFIFCGCGTIMKAFSVESPRPNKEQLAAAKEITTANVPVIAGLQTHKQRNIAQVTRAGIYALSRKNLTPAQVKGIAYIAEAGIKSVEDADGTAKMLGHSQQKTTEDILKMSVVEYGMYAAGQAVVASQNIERAKEGLKLGWQWTKGTLAAVIGGSTGGLGLIGFAIMMVKSAMNRGKLLVATGGAVEEFSNTHSDMGQELKNTLAIAHSTVAVDAKKEFGLS